MHTSAFRLVDELKIKIEKLLIPSDQNSLDSQSQEILTLVYKHLDSFEETAKTTLQTDLEKAICSEVVKLQGIVAQIGSVELSDEEDSEKEEEGEEEEEELEEGFQFGIDDVEGLKQRFDSFNRQLKMEELRCSDGLYNSFPDDDDEEDNCDADAAYTSDMIGMSDVYQQLKHKILGDNPHFAVMSLVGMPGIGKTTLARKLFDDPTTEKHFDYRVWIRAGNKCRVKDIPRCIIAQIDPDALPGLDDEEAVHNYLNKILKTEKYFIVIDDVWDRYIHCLWSPLIRYHIHELEHPFLHSESGSRILLTSRLLQLSNYGVRCSLVTGVVAMRLLNNKESWDLFRDKVFSCKGLSCPPQLVKPGKKISDKCEGLPLTILTIARLLSEEDKSTPEYWNEVATKRNHQIFMDAYDEILKVLLPSYTYLPPLLKMCFLYIGLFPPSTEIPRSKIINLWLADRFLELNVNINSSSDALRCLEDVVSNSVVMTFKASTYNPHHTIKTCGLQSSLWHLSKAKAMETKFALIISCPDDCIGEDMQGHHRLSILYNALFGMKEVHKSVEDYCASATRSLLCFGSYHPYQVPLCFRLNLLRELDALSIRFYEFPVEVLQLVQLTYLSLTTNGMIPASICQLQFLEFLIVDRHQRINSFKEGSYLPVEIWSLSALKHLQVMGSDLPDPHGASMNGLLTLSTVSARSCSAAVLKGVPSLEELYIQVELAPDDDANPFTWAHTSHCTRLKSLKCVIVNPDVVPRVVGFSSFAENHLISTLYLSGLSCPWEEMREIASLPFLKVFKLKSNAFQGPVWEVVEGGFKSLMSLVIEDVDLVDWKIGFGAFEKLSWLIIRNCYKLEKIDGKFGTYIFDVDIVDCNLSCINEMKKAMPNEEEGIWVLNVHTSWDEKKKLETTYASPIIKDIRS